jgi:TctA family transporter
MADRIFAGVAMVVALDPMNFLYVVFGCFSGTLFGPLLASVAIHFNPSDYVALMVFAFTCLASLVGKNPVKTLFAAVMGLMIASIGIDANTGVARFTITSYLPVFPLIPLYSDGRF